MINLSKLEDNRLVSPQQMVNEIIKICEQKELTQDLIP